MLFRSTSPQSDPGQGSSRDGRMKEEDDDGDYAAFNKFFLVDFMFSICKKTVERLNIAESMSCLPNFGRMSF